MGVPPMMPMPFPGPRHDREPRPRSERTNPMIQRIRRSRMLGWDHNPMRRGIDRVEAAMIAGLIVVLLIAAPILAAMAGHWTRAAGIREQHAEATWRQVSVTVQHGAPAQQDGSPGAAGTLLRLARWTAPDGRVRQGWVPVSPGTAAGSSAEVWVSPSGSLTGQPLRRSQVQWRSALAAVLTVCVLALLLSLAGCAGRHLLGRRRLADWDRAWRAVEPQWTRQR